MAVRALVTGQGPLADRLAGLLDGAGYHVARATRAVAARLAGDEQVVVTVPPAAAVGWQDALDEILLAPVQLAQRLAAAQPEPVRDAAGDLSASAQMVFVLDRAALVPGCGNPALAAASAAAAAALRDVAITLAPRLRVNAVALDLTMGADPGPALIWLLGARSVTGQIQGLGPDPRPATVWRHAAAQ